MLTRSQVDVLQDWGVGLEQSGASDELRAAGRAIRMLVDYVDELERAAWHERAAVSDQIDGAPPASPREVPEAERSFLGALAQRIGTTQ